uniref:ABC transporter permease n=1 Tax=Sporolithon durum TaxID=48970 RepID=A0A141SCZ7_9FLOR|nr:hypothetical protein Sdur_115 [Sporolithon durum]AMK96165.1 hypothetical protein Sdur_115 [Sporolithon durum]
MQMKSIEVYIQRMFELFSLNANILVRYFYNLDISLINWSSVLDQMVLVGPGSLGISILTSFCISLIFTLQIVKEFLYLDATSIVGAILALAFIRELCPVLISVIVVGRIGSSFTAEIATMKVTDQIDALYLLKTDPFLYLVLPRVIACVIMLPVLNLVAFITSLSSSVFVCFVFYHINISVFLCSVYSVVSLFDWIKSVSKTVFFGLAISNISCFSGLATTGGSKAVGKSTTRSVVMSLLAIFILDFLLSYFMFSQSDSVIKSL